jgi:hypothetical protein
MMSFNSQVDITHEHQTLERNYANESIGNQAKMSASKEDKLAAAKKRVKCQDIL